MQISLPYKAKNTLLDVLKGFIPVDIEKFTGSVEIPLKQGDVGVVRYIGHVHVKYKNKKT